MHQKWNDNTHSQTQDIIEYTIVLLVCPLVISVGAAPIKQVLYEEFSRYADKTSVAQEVIFEVSGSVALHS